MRQRDRRRWSVAVGLVLALTTACGGSGRDDADADGESSQDASPLGELLGWDSESPAESRRKQLEMEDLIAECMREEGWEYHPVDYSAQFDDGSDEDAALMSDPSAYGEKYGYGVVRNYELYEEAELSGEGEEEEVVTGTDPGFVDPNQDYVMSLSASEQEEYYASLYGEQDMDDTIKEGTVAIASGPMGCQGRANDEIYGTDPMMDNTELQERLNDYWQDAETDPRIVAANEDWVDCMGDAIDGIEVAGGPIEQSSDMYQYVDSMKYEAMGLESVPYDENDPEAESGSEYYTAYSDEKGVGEAWVGEPELIPEDELEALRERELELWREDHDCAEEAGLQRVQEAMEQELVDELRAQFPELEAAGS